MFPQAKKAIGIFGMLLAMAMSLAVPHSVAAGPSHLPASFHAIHDHGAPCHGADCGSGAGDGAIQHCCATAMCMSCIVPDRPVLALEAPASARPPGDPQDVSSRAPGRLDRPPKSS